MLNKNYYSSCFTVVTTVAAVIFAPASYAALASYSQDWESVDVGTAAEIGDGFVIGNIIVGGGQWFAGTPAPNSPVAGVNGYSAFVTGEGGAAQGNNQLSIFSDYNPWSPFTTPGTTLQTFTYRDVGTIGADDLGKTYRFSFDAKVPAGGVQDDPASQAWAYISVLMQSDGSFFNLTPDAQFDSDANLTGEWSGGFIDVTIDAGMVGELLQFGFANEATDWAPSSVFYDNLSFAEVSAIPVPAAVWLFGSGLLGLVGVARRRKS